MLENMNFISVLLDEQFIIKLFCREFQEIFKHENVMFSPS